MTVPGAGRATFGVAAGLLILAIALTIRLVSPPDANSGLPDAALDFFTLSISVFLESLPFIFLGVLLSVLVQIWLPPTFFNKLLPRRPMLRRAVMSLFGVFLPVCECGNVPLARGLIMRGFSVPESITFLLAAPILNPVTIITTYQAFGWDHGILAGRIIGGFVIANLVGWLFSKHPRQTDLLTPRFEAHCQAQDGGIESSSKVRRSVTSFAEETSAMLPALVVGSAVAGAIQVGVSREILVALGSNPIWSVLALMGLAFIIAICSNVDAFFILSFGSTFMPGSIVAFLTFGAMVDLKMLVLLRTTFTTATLVRLTTLVGLCSLILGFGVNLIA
jgi:uncharacterized membrane protein YraQ (UPF0718 family)